MENLTSKNLDYIHVLVIDILVKPSMSSVYEKSIIEMITKKVNGRTSVMAGGNIHTTDEALSSLETNIDFITLGRKLIMDPDWIEKIKNDREETIIITIGHDSQKELLIPDKLFENI